MGKIKEAFMLQQEILEDMKEELGLPGQGEFNILDFCEKRNVMPVDVKGIISKMSREGKTLLFLGKQDSSRQLKFDL